MLLRDAIDRLVGDVINGNSLGWHDPVINDGGDHALGMCKQKVNEW